MTRSPATARTARWIAVTALCVYLLSGGGRIVGSDELSMLELSRAMLHGQIAVPEGATLEGRDGRFYTKNAAAQAVLALPLVAPAELAARAIGVPPERRGLVVRFAGSLFNAVITALLLGVFYAAARALGLGAGAALGATLLLGFTTPAWVYAKSFMAEPLQALGLLLALTGAARAGAGEPGAARTAAGEAGAARSGAQEAAARTAALGAFLAVSAKLSMLPLALACLLPLGGRPLSRWGAPLLGVVLALAGHALYNAARFGTPFETGYGAQATAAAYTTPLWVGLYGLLLSSGKGVLWFAPALWLAPAGFAAMTRPRSHGGGVPERRARAARMAWAGAAAWALALVLYARFQHWAGDGSFGPRYLLPLLPLGLLVVGFALEGASRARRRVAWALALAGLAVQIGGVGIYFGAQMREAGDYPYTLPLDHRHFMESSHFNPRFSPIAGHWGMLVRNLSEHLRGEAPRLSGVGGDRRLGIGAEDQQKLLHGLDFTWAYAWYLGFPRAPILAALALLIALSAWAATRTRAAFHAESRAP